MSIGLSGLRVLDLILTASAIVVLVSVMYQAHGRRLVYVSALIYLFHSALYEFAVIVATAGHEGTSLSSFFLVWVVVLRMHATMIILFYGIYFTRLFNLRR